VAGAAFFDLDRTLMAGSSEDHFAHAGVAAAAAGAFVRVTRR
jgi:hypothetical protein